ncbi:MAG: hypothetical protein H6861_01575 [Rhodospirillales bacterium]|nr:hypothetical protein [Rhodospirillales bacterium]
MSDIPYYYKDDFTKRVCESGEHVFWNDQFHHLYRLDVRNGTAPDDKRVSASIFQRDFYAVRAEIGRRDRQTGEATSFNLVAQHVFGEAKTSAPAGANSQAAYSRVVNGDLGARVAQDYSDRTFVMAA